MVYIEYERQKEKYLDAQQRFEEILCEKEAIFERTQPKSVPFDKEKIDGGSQKNAFDEYLIEMERKKINERLAAIKSLLDDREMLLRLKEEELRRSQNIEDIVYRLKFMERKRNQQIAKIINYGEAQLYRILNNINQNIENLKT